GVKYVYDGWTNSLGDSATLGNSGSTPLTAGAALRWVKVNFSRSYLLTVSAVPECPKGLACPAPGRVESPCGVVVNETIKCYTGGGRFAAYPGTGAIFTRWMSSRDLSQSATTYIIDVPITEPTSITAVFMPAVGATASVTLQTDPQELTVIMDG